MTPLSVEQPILFISDVHLGGFSADDNARIERELIQLIDYCQQHDIRIAILGDLFDYWMEYPNHVPSLGENLLNRFESFNDELGPTLFITGNHDNWTRDHLTSRGFNLEHEHANISLNGNNIIMALHGDGLTDIKHQLPRPSMHQLIRAPKFLKYYQKILPPQAGIAIMKYFSRLTRYLDYNPDKAKKLNQWAKQKLVESHFDIIICGHDHIPRQKQFSFGTYINLGTFCHHRTIAYYNNETISLCCWNPRMQSLKPFDDNQ